MLATRAARSLGALLDLVLPRVCAVCSRPVGAGAAALVCGACWARIDPLPAPTCDRCGHPRDRWSCRWCAMLPPYVRAVRSVCWVPGGTGGAIVHALKYDGWTGIAGEMAARVRRLSWPLDVVEERAGLVPVPLAAARRRERGFNQSDLLAAALARHWGVPVWDDVLRRTRTTATQTRLTPAHRLRNVAGAFGLVGGDAAARLRGAHVVLVDDVVTTAATLNACAAALVRGGARVVSYVTFGRARGAGDRPLSGG